MAIHDWARVSPGIFHDFHLAWIAELSKALNGGVLPENVYALAEPRIGGTGAAMRTAEQSHATGPAGGVAVAERPPRLAFQEVLSEPALYALKQRRLVVRHVSGDRIVALLEIVSPGNKDGRAAARQFVDKAVSAVAGGYHLTLIDLFPPGPFDPTTLHGDIWADLGGAPYAPPPDRPLTLAAYRAPGRAAGLPAGGATAYVEPTAAGRDLIELPLFFSPDRYVEVPLAATYASAFAGVPRHLRRALEAAVGRD